MVPHSLAVAHLEESAGDDRRTPPEELRPLGAARSDASLLDETEFSVCSGRRRSELGREAG